MIAALVSGRGLLAIQSTMRAKNPAAQHPRSMAVFRKMPRKPAIRLSATIIIIGPLCANWRAATHPIGDEMTITAGP
jgi:hypothetical protein